MESDVKFRKSWHELSATMRRRASQRRLAITESERSESEWRDSSRSQSALSTLVSESGIATASSLRLSSDREPDPLTATPYEIVDITSNIPMEYPTVEPESDSRFKPNPPSNSQPSSSESNHYDLYEAALRVIHQNRALFEKIRPDYPTPPEFAGNIFRIHRTIASNTSSSMSRTNDEVQYFPAPGFCKARKAMFESWSLQQQSTKEPNHYHYPSSYSDSSSRSLGVQLAVRTLSSLPPFSNYSSSGSTTLSISTSSDSCVSPNSSNSQEVSTQKNDWAEESTSEEERHQMGVTLSRDQDNLVSVAEVSEPVNHPTNKAVHAATGRRVSFTDDVAMVEIETEYAPGDGFRRRKLGITRFEGEISSYAVLDESEEFLQEEVLAATEEEDVVSEMEDKEREEYSSACVENRENSKDGCGLSESSRVEEHDYEVERVLGRRVYGRRAVGKPMGVSYKKWRGCWALPWGRMFARLLCGDFVRTGDTQWLMEEDNESCSESVCSYCCDCDSGTECCSNSSESCLACLADFDTLQKIERSLTLLEEKAKPVCKNVEQSCEQGSHVQDKEENEALWTPKTDTGSESDSHGQLAETVLENCKGRDYRTEAKELPQLANTPWNESAEILNLSEENADLSPTQPQDGKHSLLQFAIIHFRQSPEKFEILRGEDGSIRGSLPVVEKNKKNKSKKNSKEADWTWKDQVEMVKFTKMPIQASLLSLESSEENKLALECFLAIMRYMGDYPMGKGQSEVDSVYTILMNCHKYEALRDEVYCQIMKQTTNNKSAKPDSCQRGWRLFTIVAAYFKCSETLKPFLLKYLETAAYDKRRAYHGTAMVCLQNLRKTLKYGGRKNVPSIEEITAITAGRNSKRQIYRLPGGTERVINTKSTSVVQDIIEEICAVINVRSPLEMEEYSLYCIVEGDTFTMPLAREEYILDVTTELQKNQQVYYLIFCRSVWHFSLRLDNPLYVEVVFNQIAPDYLEGLLLVMPGEQLSQECVYDIAKVGALLHKAAALEHVPTMKETKYLLPKPALSVRSMKPPQWVHLVQSAWQDIEKLTPLEAKSAVLQVLSTWNLFGSSFFAVQRIADPPTRMEHILALNKRGVHFLDVMTHETLLHYPYSEVISTRKVKSEDGALFLDMKCGNLMQQKITRIQTDQAHEIARLIRQYITIEQKQTTDTAAK